MRAATLLLVCVLHVSLATAAAKEDSELQVFTWVLCVSNQRGLLVCIYAHTYMSMIAADPELQVRYTMCSRNRMCSLHGLRQGGPELHRQTI